MKYVTIIDIAKELGISKSTVSRALAGDCHNVNAETMRRIVETADRLGYQRNELAVNLRRQHTQTIGPRGGDLLFHEFHRTCPTTATEGWLPSDRRYL